MPPVLTLKLRVAVPRSSLPLIWAVPLPAALKVTVPPRVRVPVPVLIVVLYPVRGVIPSVPIVRVPPVPELAIGVVSPVALVELMVRLPMVSVLPLKSNWPDWLMVTPTVPIMSLLSPVYWTTPVWLMVSALSMAWLADLARNSLPSLTAKVLKSLLVEPLRVSVPGPNLLMTLLPANTPSIRRVSPAPTTTLRADPVETVTGRLALPMVMVWSPSSASATTLPPRVRVRVVALSERRLRL
ncbi:MAG: hypothetical protein BWZ02_02563 [Lentisphaerae bacterium ADurb.BinA184]|nr:MAG: hypothetical protein BWZ02_02563 [Lentisphaerae bacterium ADurb.BinA184]